MADERVDYIMVVGDDLTELARTNPERIDWYRACQRRRLTEDFIREFADRVDWDEVSKYQKLSEEFLIEFADRVNWCWIDMTHELSDEFRVELKLKGLI